MMGREYPDGHPLHPNAHAKMDGHDRGGLAGWHAHKMWGRPYHNSYLILKTYTLTQGVHVHVVSRAVLSVTGSSM